MAVVLESVVPAEADGALPLTGVAAGVVKRRHRLCRKAVRAGPNEGLGAFPPEGVVAAPRRSGCRVEAQSSGTGVGEPTP